MENGFRNQKNWKLYVLTQSELKKRMRVIFNGDVRGALVKQRGAPQIEMAIRESMIARGHPEHVTNAAASI